MDNDIRSDEEIEVVSYAPVKKRRRWKKVVALTMGLASLLFVTNEDVQRKIGLGSLHLGARGLPTWRAEVSLYASNGNRGLIFGLGASLLKRDQYNSIHYSSFEDERNLTFYRSRGRKRISSSGAQESECVSQNTTEIEF